MTDKEKKVVFTLIGVMVVILLIVLCVKAFGNGGNSNQGGTDANKIATNIASGNNEQYTTLNDGTKLNTSENLKNSKTYKTVEIGDIQVTTNSSGNSAIIAKVKNNGNTTFTGETVSLTLYGENNQEIRKLDVLLPKVEAGKTEQSNWMITGDVANIKDFKIEAK